MLRILEYLWNTFCYFKISNLFEQIKIHLGNVQYKIILSSCIFKNEAKKYYVDSGKNSIILFFFWLANYKKYHF